MTPLNCLHPCVKKKKTLNLPVDTQLGRDGGFQKRLHSLHQSGRSALHTGHEAVSQSLPTDGRWDGERPGSDRQTVTHNNIM